MECKFCQGKFSERAKIMENKSKTHYVIINECNYLEDNIKGGNDKCLYGIKINYCPMCGIKFNL